MAEAQAGLADEQRRIAGLERKAGQAEAKIKDYEMYRAVVRREERHCCRRRKPAFPCDAATVFQHLSMTSGGAVRGLALLLL